MWTGTLIDCSAALASVLASDFAGSTRVDSEEWKGLALGLPARQPGLGWDQRLLTLDGMLVQGPPASSGDINQLNCIRRKAEVVAQDLLLQHGFQIDDA